MPGLIKSGYKFAFLLCVLCFFVLLKAYKKVEYVNVCNWYGMLPLTIIEQFEKETGIKIRYDVFDNNDVLEAKLLATNSGYDVVFPSLSPYVAHQLEVGVYQPLTKNLIPNLKEVDPFLNEQAQKVDKDLAFCIPYVWGTTGLIFDEDKIEGLGFKNTEGLSLIFDVNVAQKLAPFGMSFLEESIDVFPMVYRYLGQNPEDRSQEALDHATSKLCEIRPFIKRFSTDRTSNDLLMGEVIIAQFWSGDAYRTILEAKKVGKNLKYIIPKEGASLWIDVIAIPKGAPNVKNAHTFINFCLRPDIAAKISNQTYAVTSIFASRKFIEKDLLAVPFLYPSDEIIKTLKLDLPYLGEKGMDFERERLRLWTKIRQFKKEH